MLKVGEALTVKVGDDGRWTALLVGASPMSFDDRTAALEWAVDVMADRLNIAYRISPERDKWVVSFGTRENVTEVLQFSTRELALENYTIKLAGMIKKFIESQKPKQEKPDEKKRSKRKTS